MKGMVVWQVVTIVLAVAVLAFIGYIFFFYGGDINRFFQEQSCNSKKNFFCDVMEGEGDFYGDNPACDFMKGKPSWGTGNDPCE